MTIPKPSRRQFLRTSCAALSATAVAGVLERFGVVSAYARTTGNAAGDYKALVCIYLNGGNDGNNTVVPADATGYQAYSTGRGPLAIAQSALLPITPSSLGTQFGLHPKLIDLHGLWVQQKLAVVCNVGTLVQPITRTTYLNGTVPRPYQLFSHSDQTQQQWTSRADERSQIGWGGLLSDRLKSLNGSSTLPMVTSIAGPVMFSQGAITQPLGIPPAPATVKDVLVLRGFDGSAEAAARRKSRDFLLKIDGNRPLVASSQIAMKNALDYSDVLAPTSDPILNTVFPATDLGVQLLQVAKVMKLNQTVPALGLRRQIFYCQLTGFDTHAEQPFFQAALLKQVSEAMKAFYDVTVELGISASVTTFTLSDFGRTLQTSGTGASGIGSDHGWGNHHFVMGDAVRGGNFYGVPGPNGSVFPTLQLGGPDDTDTRGRWIPTTALEQYAATLATWFGVAASDLPSVFPLIGRFTTPNLGFMA
jgi:uncharacterized protein (DUF1501 family)